MTSKIDAGQIVAERSFEIGENETGLEVFRKSMKVGAELLKLVLEQILGGSLMQVSTQSKIGRRAYTNREAKASVLDWTLASEQVRNFIRAANYRPLKSPTYQALWETPRGQIVDLVEAQISRGVDGNPGEVVSLGGQGPIVMCGDGAVELTIAYQDGTKLDLKNWQRILNS
jgi:methionyl-tRNA formyltransferase